MDAASAAATVAVALQLGNWLLAVVFVVMVASWSWARGVT